MLASLVHYSNSLLKVITKNPSHPFMIIAILSNQMLIKKLKEKITIKPSRVIDSPSGIPPAFEF